MVVIRGPWESGPTAREFEAEDLAAEEMIVLTAGGSKPGRIYLMELQNGTSMTTGAAQRRKHWMGIRPFYYGYEFFTPEWDWTLGTMGDDATIVSSTVEIDFGTNTDMAPRVTMLLSDLTGAQYYEFVGEYTLVMAYTLSGGTVSMQISGDGVEGEPTYITSAGLGEVGTIRIPSQVTRQHLVAFADVEIVLSAELISGSGTLVVDKVYAIPNRHFLYTEAVMDSAGFSQVQIFTLPEDEPLQVNYNPDASLGNPQVINWEVPAEGGLFIYVGGNADNTIGFGVDVFIQVLDRWESYRA
jgi:hypothetical protein